MSRVNVYRIEPDGVVVPHAEIQNALAGAAWIWNTLSKAVGVPCDMFAYEPLWRLFGSDRLTLHQNIVLGFTFDAVWVRKGNVPGLVAALREFFREHGTGVVPTVMGIAAACEQAAAMDIRGVCFNQTSVCENPWRIRTNDDGETRPFQFDKDTRDRNGKEPWELFEGYGQALRRARTAPTSDA